MDTKDPLYSDKYTCESFTWGKSLGEGKTNIQSKFNY